MGRINRIAILIITVFTATSCFAQWEGAHYDTDTSDYRKLRGDIGMYNRLIRLSPNETKHYLERGVKYRQLKEWDKALSDIKKADSLSPDQPAIYYERALINYGKGELKMALVDLDSVTRQRPNFEWGWLDLAIVNRDMGRNEEALAALAKAMTLKPKWWLPDLIQGQVYETLELPKDAMRSYNAALVKDKLQPIVFLYRGKLHYKNGDLELAEKDLLEALRLKPNYPMAAVAMANLWNEKGQFTDALVMANLAVNLEKSYVDAYVARKNAYKGLDRMEEACNDYTFVHDKTGDKSDRDLKKCLKAHKKRKKGRP